MMQAMGTRSDSIGKSWVKRGLNLHLPLFFAKNVLNRFQISTRAREFHQAIKPAMGLII